MERAPLPKVEVGANRIYQTCNCDEKCVNVAGEGMMPGNLGRRSQTPTWAQYRACDLILMTVSDCVKIEGTGMTSESGQRAPLLLLSWRQCRGVTAAGSPATWPGRRAATPATMRLGRCAAAKSFAVGFGRQGNVTGVGQHG